MTQVAIENPILNSAFAAPTRHLRFDEDGITNDIVEGRRAGEYFMPVPAAKKKGGRIAFFGWTTSMSRSSSIGPEANWTSKVRKPMFG